MIQIQLYSTTGCHLCEQAVEVVASAFLHLGLVGEIEEVDIAESDELIDAYGTRIPVVRIGSSTEELQWPFTQEDVCRILASQS